MQTTCFNVLSYLLFMEGNFVLSMELNGLLPLPLSAVHLVTVSIPWGGKSRKIDY